MVYKLHKALYGLKQAPRAWYETLKDFLLKKDFKPGTSDPTLFTRSYNGELFVCQIYVDDIIFGCTNPDISEEFAKMMSKKYEISMMGELKFLCRLYITWQCGLLCRLYILHGSDILLAAGSIINHALIRPPAFRGPPGRHRGYDLFDSHRRNLYMDLIRSNDL